MLNRPSRWIVIAVAALSLLLPASVAAQDASGTPTANPVVVRTVLSQGEPAAAPGRVLQLVQFTISAHLKLPVHTHPGMQTAWLESGMLQYTVVAGGPVPVVRASATPGTPGRMETLSAGQTATFHPGDSWTEPEGMVHFAENTGDVTVVILVASLLTEGAPPATVINAATPTS